MQKVMKKIGLLAVLCSLFLAATAQKDAPKWMNKEKKAVFSVVTYSKDGARLSSGTGFFVTETGEALSGYSLFKGAYKAVVTDIDGNEWPVVSVLGANELYDVVRFKVNVPKKVTCLPVANEPQPVGTAAYLLPYSVGKVIPFKQGTITETSKVEGDFGYYKLDFPLESNQKNAPVLTSSGEVFGLAQEDATGRAGVSYAMSAGFTAHIQIAPTDAFNSTYSSIGIRKGWPEELEQATVALFLLTNREDAPTHLETLNDFIATFPDAPDGYLSRASHYAYNRSALADTPAGQNRYLDLAMADMEAAAKRSDKKSDVLYNRAKLIFGVAAADSTLNNPAWSADAALQALDQAIAEESLPVYHQLKGDILYYRQQYAGAFDEYSRVNASDMASPQTYYWAARSKAAIPGTQLTEIIALLDSAVVKTGNPPTRDAAPYVLERVEYEMQLGLYPQAIAGYDLYYKLMDGQVSDAFYFYREKAKFMSDNLEGALSDIQEAIKLSPGDAAYYAEAASVNVRMEKYDDALEYIGKALALAPDFAGCYRLRGVCYLRQKKNPEACEALQKGAELGDPVAAKLLKEHCK